MAGRIDNVADYFLRNSDMPTIDPMTVCMWTYLVADLDTPGYFFIVVNAGGTVNQGIRTGGDGTTLTVHTSSSNAGGTNLSLSTWYHIAYVRNGTSHTVYLNGVQDSTITQSLSLTPAAMLVGSSTVAWNSARYANVKIWSGVALTAAEIQLEMYFATPVRTANLHLFTPMLKGNRTTDYSGNGRNWTEGGTITDEDEPPVTWRSQPHYRPIVVSTGGQNASVNASAATGVGLQLSTSVGNLDRTVNLSGATGLGYNVVSVPGAINSAVNNAGASGVGYALTANQIQSIGQALATGLGYQVGYSVGAINATVNKSDGSAVGYSVIANQTQSINKSDASGVGYNLTTSQGNVNATVNKTDASAVGLQLSANYIQAIANAVSSAVGYNVGYSVGGITQAVNKTDASALGYEVNTVTGSLTPVELASATGLGYVPMFSSIVNASVNKSDGSGVGYNVGNTLFQSVNRALATGLGYAPNTTLVQTVANAVSSAIGYDASAFTTGQTIGVNQALASGLGYQPNFTVGAIIITVNLAQANATGKEVINGEFVIILSRSRMYIVGMDNRVYEPFENRTFIARD